MTNQQDFYSHLRQELQDIRAAGLFKGERIIATPQGAHIRTVASDGKMREVLNLCANNYLGMVCTTLARASVDVQGLTK